MLQFAEDIQDNREKTEDELLDKIEKIREEKGK